MENFEKNLSEQNKEVTSADIAEAKKVEKENFIKYLVPQC